MEWSYVLQTGGEIAEAHIQAQRRKKNQGKEGGSSSHAANVAGSIFSYRRADCQAQYAAINPQESAARSAHFSVPHLGSKTIQHAIDVLVTIDAAKRLGQLNGFVDHHLVVNFDVILQFECTYQQGGMLYRR